MAVFRFDIVEGRHRLDDVGIRVDGSHDVSPKSIIFAKRIEVSLAGTMAGRQPRCLALQHVEEKFSELRTHADGETRNQRRNERTCSMRVLSQSL
jgi:hypothetical protein